jgi:flavin reductase (DIM6/NTAB) family NADH-FMN oxidoreductase RutF
MPRCADVAPRIPLAKKSLPLSEVYRLLEPGPVVLVSTGDHARANIMAMSWHTMMEFEPPLVGCVISERNHTFGVLRATKECVINIPTVELARQVVGCGNSSGKRVDKFRAFGLTPVAASQVKAPLIEECYANRECRVVDTRLVAAYNFFVLEVVKAWSALEGAPADNPPRGKGSLHGRRREDHAALEEEVIRGRADGRAERSLPLWQRQEVQGVLPGERGERGKRDIQTRPRVLTARPPRRRVVSSAAPASSPPI